MVTQRSEAYTAYLDQYEGFVFGLDDVIYPSKDYWLQVFYLFAQFIEYGEQIEAGPVVGFMQDYYDRKGLDGVFESTAAKFGLPEKYKINFELLEQNARLPLKLIPYAAMLQFLLAVKDSRKPVFLLAAGDPLTQLNKIRQMEWNGLERDLKVFFLQEMGNSYQQAIGRIAAENGLKTSKILLVDRHRPGRDLANFNNLNYLPADKFI